jgi:hypothetical protein
MGKNGHPNYFHNVPAARSLQSFVVLVTTTSKILEIFPGAHNSTYEEFDMDLIKVHDSQSCQGCLREPELTTEYTASPYRTTAGKHCRTLSRSLGQISRHALRLRLRLILLNFIIDSNSDTVIRQDICGQEKSCIN